MATQRLTTQIMDNITLQTSYSGNYHWKQSNYQFNMSNDKIEMAINRSHHIFGNRFDKIVNKKNNLIIWE